MLVVGCWLMVVGCWLLVFSFQLLNFASSRLRVRRTAEGRFGGVSEGFLPPHPRPRSPGGGEGGDLVFSCQFSVASC
ncbi:MAG: hypothetical protein ACK46M_18165 [Planctomyces sp.]